MQSGLGQAFQASIDVIGLEEELNAGCLDAILYSSDGTFIVRPHVSINRRGLNPGLLLSTRRLVHEPGVLVSIDISCPAPIQRQYQILLDPPELYPDARPESARAGGGRRIGAATAGRQMDAVATGLAPADDGAASSRKHLGRPDSSSPARRSHQAPQHTARPHSMRPAHRDVLRLSGNDLPGMFRLKMADALSIPGNRADAQRQAELRAAQQRFAAMIQGEPLPRNNAAQTMEPAATTLPVRPASESGAAIPPPVFPTSDEIKERSGPTGELPAAALGEQSADTRTSAVQARQLKPETVSPTWFYTLAALLALCMGTIAWLVWQMRVMHRRQSQPWWENPPRNAAANLADAPLMETASQTADAGPGESDVFAVESLRSELREAPAGLDSIPGVTLPKELPAKNLAAGLPNLEHTISQLMSSFSMKSTAMDVEELSDVTQEAEFWMSLNDPKRAIEILEPQCIAEHPDTPIPWLYLLDLYHEVNERIKYDAMRARFMAVFNAYIPEFDAASIAPTRSLEDFPHLIRRICQTWPSTDTMRFLEGLLIDDRGGARIGFELAVYRDILFLISILQERALQEKLEEVPGRLP